MGAVVQREVAVSRIFPPKENEGPNVTTSLRVPVMMIEKLDRIAKAEGCTRTEAMLHLWRFGIQEWEAEQERSDGPRRAVK